MTQPLTGKPTFGAGRVFATANVTNPTPARALVPQSQAIDFKRKTESLFGEFQLAVAVGAGEMDVTGKVEFGKIQPRFFSDIILADTGATGSYFEADGESGTVTTGAITVVNSGTWQFDLGVVNPTTGATYTRVASAPAVGQYSVASGVYSFNTGENGTALAISYAYNQSSVGETIAMTNQLQGLTGNFQAVHVLPWGTQQDMFVLNSCIASGSGISAKKSGFAMNTLDYVANVDSTNKLGTATFAISD